MIQLPTELLDTFGKILYAVAKSDGIVQDEELAVIRKVIDDHTWAQELELSFVVEREMDTDADEVFEEAMEVFDRYDVREHYEQFLDLLDEVAEAHGGIVNEEKTFIDRFRKRLLN
ncbi:MULTISPECIES: TerB family tellurite resistance protein [Reichenbachiella]|uniref:Tellurite resistance protein TerB n=1 Tax=Reichenbachiella agariperforans TaxID=156994 RepID=A0A1M6JY35_REIAG|nr:MULTISPECIES: TerB family tellurite resistance protein [Reichenbachiella]MBU2913349.1 TerB family tellurite resistance protein [Reichenbachiella agariperforans]RJE74667.1 hypothetical protein BGP76_16150 [Reichenbachiella sp. MSK19-1]SHJ51627.1 Tellurite resistance protein TerB [Reichenbachiella agariperforans]